MTTPMNSPMNNPMPTVQPSLAGLQRRKKIRPFSLIWGLLFLILGSAGFASGSGVRPGLALSITFILGSVVVLYLIMQQRRQVAAPTGGITGAGAAPAGVSTATATPAASPGDELYQQALAELDSVDYTVASPEQVLSDDTTDPGEATSSTEAG